MKRILAWFSSTQGRKVADLLTLVLLVLAAVLFGATAHRTHAEPGWRLGVLGYAMVIGATGFVLVGDKWLRAELDRRLIAEQQRLLDVREELLQEYRTGQTADSAEEKLWLN